MAFQGDTMQAVAGQTVKSEPATLPLGNLQADGATDCMRKSVFLLGKLSVSSALGFDLPIRKSGAGLAGSFEMGRPSAGGRFGLRATGYLLTRPGNLYICTNR
jgi:hypothetical protein